jgi:hypothetical protein
MSDILAVSKRARQKFDLEIFELRKLNVNVKEKYQVGISKRFKAEENFDENLYIHSAWDSIRGNINTSAKESLGYQRLKFHKT